MKYPHVAARLFNAPLLIHPLKLDAILGGLSNRLFGAPLIIQNAPTVEDEAVRPEMFSTRRGERADRGYRIVDGVAVIGINGALVHRSKVDADSNFLLGYNDMAADVEDAMANPDVHALLSVYESPGGEAQGAFEFGARIHGLRGKKPMYAIADGIAASAAYLGASAHDVVAVTMTGYAGSVGVVLRHVDFSRLIANEGITVTHLFEGAHKVDGNAYEALPDSVRADWQAELKRLYGMFTGNVATYRAMQEDAVRATQARTYMGDAAVTAGLADRVSTTDELITELAALRVRSYPVGQSARSTQANDKGANMSGNQPAADGNQSAPTGLTQADLDQAIQAERARTSGILAHAEAAGRTELAHQCVATGLSVEQAGKLMAAAPKASADGKGFATVMASLNPNVDGKEGPEANGENHAVVSASWDKAFGVKKA